MRTLARLGPRYLRSITPVPILYLAAFCLLFAPAVRAAHAESFVGKVVEVIDGDTIIIMREDSPKRVRLYGVDAPEIGQDYGLRARRLVLALTGGREVTVKCRETDEYGTTLANVILSGRIVLNREIIRAGYAWCHGSKDEILKRLQAQARKKKMGLWAGREPVAPWVYRRLLKEHTQGEISGSVAQAATMTGSPAEQTVYVTKTGKKYHRTGCRSLRKGRIPMTLEAAVEKGYEPCSICRPPSLDLLGSGSQSRAVTGPLPEAEDRPPGPGDEPDERLKPERVIYTGPRAGSFAGKDSPSEQTVYVTKTGKKYHRAGCRSLRKNRIPMTLEDAVEKGYKPCRICRPASPHPTLSP